jgi:outer membrane protein TolC
MLINIEAIFAQAPSNTTILEKLIEEAVNNNPELKAFEEKIQVFKERPSQASSLDDPRLRLAFLNLPVDTFRFDQENMTQKQASIMQKFPFPGKLSLKGNMAEKELEIVREEYADKKNNIIMQVEVTYQNLLFINKAIEITEENKNLLREFVKIAETKYTVGKGIQQDVLKAQVELSKMIDRLIVLDQKKKTAEARLNTLLNRPTQMPFTDLGQIKQSHFSLPFEDLQRIAEDNHPVLYGLRHLIDRFRFAARLAEKEYYPDFDVGVSYGQRDDSSTIERADFFSVFVTMNIPLWYKTKQTEKYQKNRQISGESRNSTTR